MIGRWKQVDVIFHNNFLSNQDIQVHIDPYS